MKKILALFILLALFTLSCNKENDGADAWGNFEATEVLISAETNGKILTFPVEEGNILSRGDIIAVIDTTIITLQLKELESTELAVRSNIRTISSQNEILEQQISNLEVNISRISNMLNDGAATQKQYDDLVGQKAVFQKQIESNNTRKSSVRSELAVLESKKDQLRERILRSTVTAPSKGTVLQKYAEMGEITAAGKPLIKLADLNTMKLKVYISGGQLADVKIGDSCTIRIDKGENEYHEYTGEIIIVSDKAEFTPKIIQTKEERVSMVYALTIAVENDGKIKSGMPAEALFGNPE